MDEQLEFRIPIHPGDLQNVDGSYGVENAINVDSLSEKQLSKIVDGNHIKILGSDFVTRVVRNAENNPT